MNDFRSSDNHARILKAIGLARRQVAPIVKDQTDPESHRAFASLPAIIDGLDPVLESLDISPMPYPIVEGGMHGAAIRFNHKSGEWLEFRMLYPLGPAPAMSDVSASATNARRAIYNTVFDLRVADDQEAGHGEPNANQPARSSGPRQAPGADLIARAKDVERQVAERIGRAQAATMVQAEVGVRFFSAGDARRIESFIAKASELLKQPAAPPADAASQVATAPAA